MNKEEIDKWLDNEYGVSYTKLEELHDFYFEKYCDLKEENKELKKQLEEYKDKIKWYENFEVNKTIDKLRLKHNAQQKEFINYLEDNWKQTQDIWYIKILQKYKEIIGSDINVGSIGGKE